ncbi:MAG: hypothetical protein PVG35_09980 [Desulfobacterales bacterium]
MLLPVLLYFIFSGKRHHATIYLFAAIAAAGVIIRYFAWHAFVASAHGQTRIMSALVHTYYPTYCRLDGLLVGVAIASLFKYRPLLREKLLKHGNGLLVLSIALLVATYFLFGGSLISHQFTSLKTAVFGFPLVSFAYGLMVIAAMSPNCPLFRYPFWPTTQLATLSYCIYLSHKMVNHVVHTQTKFVFGPDSYRVFAICLLGVILCGLILHLIVEKPFLVVRAKLHRKASFRLTGMR